MKLLARSAPGGTKKPCAEETDDLFQAERGSEVRQLLQHYFEVNPRNEDLDISANLGPGGVGAPAGRITVADWNNDDANIGRVRIQAKQGLVLYLGAYEVSRSAGSLDLSSTVVVVKKGGVQVGFLPRGKFERRVFLDRDDVLELAIKNTSGAPIVYDYRVEGFARRAGIPVMQPDRSQGRS